MQFREAQLKDIDQIMFVRMSVRENVLSNPSLVTEEDCAHYITVLGKGWVCETRGTIVGFAIADLVGKNIWALFVLPDYERTGIGKELHRIMLDWYFGQTKDTVWLSTAPGSRAEGFYRAAGWKETGITKSGEVRFEMAYSDWKS